MQKVDYAAVDRFEVVEDAVPDGVVTGLAAPAAGERPCGVILMSGAEMISCAAAAEFSGEAQARGIRLGWCGFTLGGLGQAAALADDVEIRCIVSNNVLVRWKSLDLGSRLCPSKQNHISVEAMLAVVRGKTAIHSFEQLKPFAMAYGRARGITALAEVLFHYLLKRHPDDAAKRSLLQNRATEDSLEDLWQVILKSDEYLIKENTGLLGPYDPEFPFLLSALDHKPSPASAHRK